MAWLATAWRSRLRRSPATVGRESVLSEEALAMAEHGARALALAGRALDPNAPRGPSVALGQLLLKEAYLAAARVLSGDLSIATVEAASDALGRCRAPATGGRRDQRAEVVAALGGLPDRAALAQAEMEVAYLVDEGSAEPRLGRVTRRACWVLGLVVVAAAAALILLDRALAKPWEDYAWSASSAWSGFPQSGTLGQHGAYGLLFHTEEQVDPWVVVDLGKTRTIHQLLVRNRADLDSDRGLPLVLEIGLEDRQFVPISTRSERFDVWNVKLAPRAARYVRLRAQGRTILHLREIQIR